MLFDATAYMWRSNVLVLRKCSSAATWRNARLYSSQTSLPITNGEFEQALGETLACMHREHRPRHHVTSFPDRLGFAISGGVDSMALAALYAKSQRHVPYAHAFIVDHKVRPESTAEAEWVAEQCRSKFGMEATVLPLFWPADFDPLDHKRFETDARALRYQALGRACRAARIHTLCVAHHADDQAETVLMRLANNRLRSGLQAMQPVEWIPECYGIHGVSHSGRTYHNHNNPPLAHMPFPVESGGIRVLRPLLSFDKARLIATCEQHGVAWAEDKTNHLQTYTARNAIRHILKNNKLPAALSIKSLVDVSDHMQKRISGHKLRANQLLRRCEMQLDLQTSSLSIRFPSFRDLLPKHSHHSPTHSDLTQAKNNATYLLAQVGQIVAAKESPPLGELAAIAGDIWPEFLELEKVDSSQAVLTGSRTNFSVFTVWWRKRETSSVFPNVDSQKLFNKPEWLLTRQPPEHHRPGTNSGPIVYPPSHVVPLTQDVSPMWPSEASDRYQLFDGRWWISIKNHTTDELVLRLFTKRDLARLPSARDAQRSGARWVAAAALSLLKPADLRLTLPAVFRRDAVTKEETLVGFPTLNVSVDRFGFPADVCTCRVRYKKIELHPDQLGSTVVPGLTHEMIKKELARLDRLSRKFANSKDSENAIENAVLPSRQQRAQVAGKHTVVIDTNSKRRNMTQRSKVEELSDHPEAIVPRPIRKIANKAKTLPLVPAVESERRGKSKKRENGGYDIKWEEFKHRFD